MRAAALRPWNYPELDFEVFPMAFPTDQDTPKLQSGIWGLGVFDTGETERMFRRRLKTFLLRSERRKSCIVSDEQQRDIV